MQPGTGPAEPAAMDEDGLAAFEELRPRLTGLAYRMLGEVQEAEDAVQDAYLRWNGTDRAAVEDPRAWLFKVVTNLCLNRLASARARRETYTGPWLPEPIRTSSHSPPARCHALGDCPVPLSRRRRSQ
ncbi:sigma factor [Actinomadura opuntiae]|uniref:sigma factor n=1 Tax=Actinomadura sp. OS1-43 TaxID=604315 RepID=UPI00333E7894